MNPFPCWVVYSKCNDIKVWIICLAQCLTRKSNKLCLKKWISFLAERFIWKGNQEYETSCCKLEGHVNINLWLQDDDNLQYTRHKIGSQPKNII